MLLIWAFTSPERSLETLRYSRTLDTDIHPSLGNCIGANCTVIVGLVVLLVGHSGYASRSRGRSRGFPTRLRRACTARSLDRPRHREGGRGARGAPVGASGPWRSAHPPLAVVGMLAVGPCCSRSFAFALSVLGFVACLVAPVWPGGAAVVAGLAWVPATLVGHVARTSSTCFGALAPRPAGPTGVLLVVAVCAGIAVAVFVRGSPPV